MGSVDVCSDSTMTDPDPHDTCPRCHTEFGYVGPWDPIAFCSYCTKVFHKDCLPDHLCPKAVKADQAALRAWGLASAGWRK